MAMEQDPLQRRKQERAKKRKAAKRKRILKIGLGALAMLVVGCVVFLLIADPFGFRQQKEIPPSAVIHLAAAGDLTISDRVVASGGDSYDFTKTFLDVGHLLGSSCIELWLTEGDTTKKIVFSGDVGNTDQPLIKDPLPVEETALAMFCVVCVMMLAPWRMVASIAFLR